jgi:hypothetical protein
MKYNRPRGKLGKYSGQIIDGSRGRKRISILPFHTLSYGAGNHSVIPIMTSQAGRVKTRVVDPHWFQCGSGSGILGPCGSESGILQLKKIHSFLYQKLQIYLSLEFYEERLV